MPEAVSNIFGGIWEAGRRAMQVLALSLCAASLSTPLRIFLGSATDPRYNASKHPGDAPRPSRSFADSPGGSVHVLVTADTLSGAWTYTRELVTGLVTRGVRVTPGQLRRDTHAGAGALG